MMANLLENVNVQIMFLLYRIASNKLLLANCTVTLFSYLLKEIIKREVTHLSSNGSIPWLYSSSLHHVSALAGCLHRP